MQALIGTIPPSMSGGTPGRFHWARACLIVIALLCAPAAETVAQVARQTEGVIPGIRIQLGLDEAAVRQAYDIRTPVQIGGNGRKTLRVSGLGLLFFFNEHGLNNSIRMDPPFAEAVRGVRLGDTLETLQKHLGTPNRPPWNFGIDVGYLYDLDPVAQVRYDVATNGRIVRIFVLLRGISS